MKRGKKYQEAVKSFDKAAQYDVAEAISLVKKNATAKFDETIELHIRTGCDGRHAEQQIRGADTGERQIVIPVKNFINDSYCRDISTKVKSQLAVKRKAGECLSPFAVYGYRKSPENKNKLVVDDYAAEIVRRIFRWKIEGMAVSAIAKKLNELHILSPKEYKKSTGLNYRGGFTGGSGSQWSSSSVKRDAA